MRFDGVDRRQEVLLPLQAEHWRDRIDKGVERLRAVVINSMDAADLIRRYDDPKTSSYIDPPRLPSTRTARPRRCLASTGTR